jgi:hypothetical protein
VIGGFGADLWKLGLLRYSTRGATIPRVPFTPRVVAAARVVRARGTPAAGQVDRISDPTGNFPQRVGM